MNISVEHENSDPANSGRGDDALEAMRAEIEAILDQQRNELIALLDALSGPEHSDEADALRTSISALDSEILSVRHGSPQMVADMARRVTTQAGATQAIISQQTGSASLQSGVLMAEFTAERLEQMSISAMADTFTAQHFAQMSDAQLDQIGRQVNSHVEASLAADASVHGEIEAAAARSGENLSAYRMHRAMLQVEEEEARRRGDTQDLARIAYLRSQNALIGAQEAGADPAFIEARRNQMEADEQALRLKTRETAAREARELGLTGAAAAAYIDQAESTTMAVVREQEAAIAADRDVEGRDREEVTAEKLYLDRDRLESNRDTQSADNQVDDDNSELSSVVALGELNPSATPVSTAGTSHQRQ